MKRGGTLLAEGRPALFDGNLVGGAPAGALDGIFGIAPLDFTGFADENCEPRAGAQRHESGLLLLEPKLQSKDSSNTNNLILFKGRAILYNVSFCEYRDWRLNRLDPKAQAIRTSVAGPVGSALPPRSWLPLPGADLPIVSQRWRRGTDQFLTIAVNVRRRPALALNSPRIVVRFLDNDHLPKNVTSSRRRGPRPDDSPERPSLPNRARSAPHRRTPGTPVTWGGWGWGWGVGVGRGGVGRRSAAHHQGSDCCGPPRRRSRADLPHPVPLSFTRDRIVRIQS